MASFIQNPIAYGVRSDAADQTGGPLDQELVAGANISITPFETVPGSGDINLRISSTGGSANTYVATTAPTAENDAIDSAGIGRAFGIGDYWLQTTTGILYYCTDETPHAAVWATVDTTQYVTETLLDNTNNDLNMGAVSGFAGKYLRYRLSYGTSARFGQMSIGHNGAGTAEVVDDYGEMGTKLPITVSALVSSGNLILRITTTAVGGSCTFRYYAETLA